MQYDAGSDDYISHNIELAMHISADDESGTRVQKSATAVESAETLWRNVLQTIVSTACCTGRVVKNLSTVPTSTHANPGWPQMDCAQSRHTIGPSSDSRQHISDKVHIPQRDRMVEIQRHTVPHIKESACINHWAEDSKDGSPPAPCHMH